MIAARLSRFIISGGLNTALTYAGYYALLQFLPYHTSYTVAYLSGIALAYVLNRYFVFRGHRGSWSIAALPLIYLAQYLFGLFLIWVCVERVGVSDVVAPLLVIMISMPFTYFLSRWAFLGKPK
jgi:putative flippase GtrA